MKKMLIGSLVGGIILFGWQFLSWAALNLHEAQQKYTPKQDSVMAYLGTQFQEDGAYMMPTFPPGTSRADMEKQMKALEGKPWAQLVYHKSMPGESQMYRNMARGLVIDIVIILLLCSMLTKITNPNFATIFFGALGTGMIVFLTAPYIHHIWYPSFDLMAHFTDALVPWALIGIWLGWWLRRK